MKWDLNIEAITKKKKKDTSNSICCGSLDPLMLIQLFLSSFMITLLRVFSHFICWLYNLNAKQRNSLQRTVNFNSQTICDQVRHLPLFCDCQMLHKVKSISKDPEHALYGEFECLPHGRRFRSLVCKTNRRAHPFVPTAVRLLNRVSSALITKYGGGGLFLACEDWGRMFDHSVPAHCFVVVVFFF